MNSNNQMIQKGKISTVEGAADRNGDKTTARVLPCTADGMVTRPSRSRGGCGARWET